MSLFYKNVPSEWYEKNKHHIMMNNSLREYVEN